MESVIRELKYSKADCSQRLKNAPFCDNFDFLFVLMLSQKKVFFLVGLHAVVFLLASSACKNSDPLGINEEECRTSRLQESRSPNGKMKAVLFYKDCSNIHSTIATNVSILPSDEKLLDKDHLPEYGDSSGNVFSAREDNGLGYPASANASVKVNWIDDNHLVIDYKPAKTRENPQIELDYNQPEKSRILKAEKVFDKIKISYK